MNPRPHLLLEQLAASVERTTARLVLREITNLANEAPQLTDEQLRGWLRVLAELAAHRSR